MTDTTTGEYPGENGEYHYAERSGYQEFEDGTLTPKGLKKRNAHLAHIEGQNQVIRDRNATIARLQAQLSEYAHALEKRPAAAREFFNLGEEHAKLMREAGEALSDIIVKAPDGRPVGEAIREAMKEYIAEMDKISVTATITDTLGTIRALQKRIGEANAANGWHERAEALKAAGDKEGLLDHAFAKLFLVVTELSEAGEEARDGRDWNEVYYKSGSSKPEGFGVELADALIRIFDTADILDIDLAAAIDVKLRANAKRGYKHGGRLV